MAKQNTLSKQENKPPVVKENTPVLASDERFSIISFGKPAVALVQISKRESIVFNRFTEEVTCKPFGAVPIATQEQLKKVYDAGPQYKDWVNAPAEYKAPWEQQN